MGLFDEVKSAANSAADKVNNFLSGKFNNALTSILPTQGSNWDGLNNNLIARFYPVKAVGSGENRRFIRDLTAIPVHAPILEGAELEYQLNWQSPFEQMGTEAKAPALTAMLQSGMLTDFFTTFTQSTGLAQSSSETGQDKSKVISALKEMEGRTGITKLNSTQTFSGMPPIKCTMKLLFRAYSDPKAEVMKPLQQLIEWAMPQELSPDGALSNLVQAASGNGKWIDVLLPSKAPRLMAMEYKGRVYKPMVIEMISDPITSPTTASGDYAKAEVNLTLASLSAWDKSDVAKIYGGGAL